MGGLEEYWLFVAILVTRWNVIQREWTSCNQKKFISQMKAETKPDFPPQKKKHRGDTVKFWSEWRKWNFEAAKYVIRNEVTRLYFT